jgi:hypothetical protein
MDKVIKYIPIDKISEAASENNITITGLFVKTVIIVIIILGFVLISYLILSKLTGKKVENMEVTAPPHITEPLNVQVDQTSNSLTSVSESSPTLPVETPSTEVSSSIPTISSSVEMQTPEELYKVKTTYTKLQEITDPSSLDGPKGYISRDNICYRYRAKDDTYVKKRFGCIACQVDNRTNIVHDYDGTNTNVAATCVYAKNEDPTDHSIWTREKCVNVCSNDPEFKDIS